MVISNILWIVMLIYKCQSDIYHVADSIVTRFLSLIAAAFYYGYFN